MIVSLVVIKISSICKQFWKLEHNVFWKFKQNVDVKLD